MCEFSTKDLNRARWLAEVNWSDWRRDFEHSGKPDEIPILNDQARFHRFCQEYSVLRYKTLERKKEVWVFLCKKNRILNAVTDTSGLRIDHLAKEISKEFSSPDDEDKFEEPRSLLSKLASFIRPAEFIAYDRYARRGAHYVANRSAYPVAPAGGPLRYPLKNFPYNNYSDYRRDVRKIQKGSAGNQIRNFIGNDPRGEAFTLRVIDCCLMMVGNRWVHAD